MNGIVDLTDFTFLAANFNTSNKDWLRGDYNYDGNVDLTDFTILAGNFNKTLAASSAAPQASALPATIAFAGFKVMPIDDHVDVDPGQIWF